MRLANGPERFGAVSIFLHWTIAVGLLGMVGFGLWLARAQIGLEGLWLYSAHKSVGLVVLILTVFRILWHRISPPPPPLPVPGRAWEAAVARAMHRLLTALSVAIPLTGWIASSATGIDTLFFGLRVPPIAPPVAWVETGFFAAHAGLSWLLIACVALHGGAALRRQWIDGDGTLGRMLGRPPAAPPAPQAPRTD